MPSKKSMKLFANPKKGRGLLKKRPCGRNVTRQNAKCYTKNERGQVRSTGYVSLNQFMMAKNDKVVLQDLTKSGMVEHMKTCPKCGTKLGNRQGRAYYDMTLRCPSRCCRYMCSPLHGHPLLAHNRHGQDNALAMQCVALQQGLHGVQPNITHVQTEMGHT
eukprot:5769364-Amphidinium_carterae.1